MEYDGEQQPYEDESRGYRERSRSPRADGNGDDARARSASPGRDRMDSRAPPPAASAPQDEEEDEAARNPGTNLFVTGIHPKLSEGDIIALFERFGQVEKANIMRDPHSKESRGFGFVNMMNGVDADAAKEALQGEVIEGRTLSIEKARRSKPRHPTPGKYFGPPKQDDFRGPPRGGGRFHDRYEDRRGGYGRRDDYRDRGSRYGGGGRYDDRYDDRGYGGGGGGRRDRYDDRPPRDSYSSRDDRGYGGGRRGGGGGGYHDREPRREAPAFSDSAAPRSYDRGPPSAPADDSYGGRR